MSRGLRNIQNGRLSETRTRQAIDQERLTTTDVDHASSKVTCYVKD
jgi:hypothetical protein